jgi:RNA polymerase sporulation-specific sigma factor
MDFYENIDIFPLLEMVRNSDDAAFAELVRRYTPMMNKVAQSFSLHSTCHDEFFSEACIALHRAALSFDLSRNEHITFGLYAKICVYRRISDMARTSASDEQTVDVDVDSISSGASVEENILFRERISEYLRTARSILSEYEQDVFMLYIEGYSASDIAKKLSRDVKSVENAKSRIFKNLREMSKLFSDI